MINFDGANVSERRKYDLLTFCVESEPDSCVVFNAVYKFRACVDSSMSDVSI